LVQNRIMSVRFIIPNIITPNINRHSCTTGTVRTPYL
jgi:hypothetical protein